jgi:hypothetical protein
MIFRSWQGILGTHYYIIYKTYVYIHSVYVCVTYPLEAMSAWLGPTWQRFDTAPHADLRKSGTLTCTCIQPHIEGEEGQRRGGGLRVKGQWIVIRPGHDMCIGRREDNLVIGQTRVCMDNSSASCRHMHMDTRQVPFFVSPDLHAPEDHGDGAMPAHHILRYNHPHHHNPTVRLGQTLKDSAGTYNPRYVSI